MTTTAAEVPLSLAGLMVLQLALAEVWTALRREADARSYVAGAAVSALLAAYGAVVLSPEHPATAAGVFGVAAPAWLLINRHGLHAVVSYLALTSLFGCAWFVLVLTLPELDPVERGYWAMLVHGTGCLLLVLGLGARRSATWLESVYVLPARRSASAGSVLAVSLLLASTEAWQPARFAIATGWLAAIWLVLACTETSVFLFGAFQAALTAAVVSGALTWAQSMGWQLDELRTVYAAGVSVAGLSLAWEAVRRWLGEWPSVRRLLPERVPAVDRVVVGGLIASQMLLAVAGVLPDVAAELNRSVDVVLPLAPGWQAAIAGPDAWLILAVLAVTLFVAMRSSNVFWPTHGLLLLALTAAVLLALSEPGELRGRRPRSAGASHWCSSLFPRCCGCADRSNSAGRAYFRRRRCGDCWSAVRWCRCWC